MSVLFIDSESEPVEHGTAVPPAVCAQVALDDGPVEIVSPERGRELLEGHRGPVVGHALAFEALVLGARPAEAYDTQIRAVIQGAAEGRNEKASSSLADLARPLGVTLTGKGSVQLSFRRGARLTAEQESYARQDVVATRAVWRAQGGTRRLPDEERQLRASYDVMTMARRGVRIDEGRVRSLLTHAHGEVARLLEAVKAAGLTHETGPKKARRHTVSRDAVQARLAALGATQRPKRRAQDPRPPSTLLDASGAVLREFGDPALVALADYKDAEKRVALVEAFDVGPVARAFWKPMVASGRIAASRPNLTQVPKGELRACVVPSEGNVLVTADFSALEFRAWADVCERWLGWSDAAEALRAGVDPHTHLAAQLDGDRQAAKAGNYGLIGGMGVARLAATYDLSEERAAEVAAAWRATWGEARSYFRRIKAGDAGGGRYRVVVPWSGRERLGFYSEAANFVIQATGADVAKEALMRATRAGLPVTMLIHDELVLDVPRADAEEAARLLVACMNAAGREVCPNVPWNEKAVIRERWA